MPYLHHLQQKPDHVKSQIAFGVSSVVTFFIFMFWLSGVIAPSKEIVKKDTPNPSISSMTANVVDAFRKGFGTEKEYVAPDIEVLPGDK